MQYSFLSFDFESWVIFSNPIYKIKLNYLFSNSKICQTNLKSINLYICVIVSRLHPCSTIKPNLNFTLKSELRFYQLGLSIIDLRHSFTIKHQGILVFRCTNIFVFSRMKKTGTNSTQLHHSLFAPEIYYRCFTCSSNR